MYFVGLLGATTSGNTVYTDGVFKYKEAGGDMRSDVITTGSVILHGPDETPAIVIWIEQKEALVSPIEAEPTAPVEGDARETADEPTLSK